MHAFDLDQLVIFHVTDKLIEHWVISRTGLIEQVLYHFHCALVMRNHQL